ncbi:MAG: sugar ABC transporter permease [Oscillospiraceae bacterium]|jgi:arabinogalactan oligomer/maltooligosaccharide transport system permease protein|nr:sugar ABC transporter permease [Oscillospiraceae bacterium]
MAKNKRDPFYQRLAGGFNEYFRMFREGDAWTRLSYLIMGAGSFARGQIVKGLLFLSGEAAFVWFYAAFGWRYLKDFGSLGTNAQLRVWDEIDEVYRRVPGDNSMLILLYSVLTLAAILPLVMLWKANVRAAFKAQKIRESKQKPPGFITDLRTLLDSRFHMTLLSFPMVTLALFTALPIVFMVLIAFTNFDKAHQPPGSLFSWTGLANIRGVISSNPLYARSFGGILGWTFVWAVFATFSNYILGIVLALMINKKGIRLKRMWRTIFVTTIAIPQFVSLMLVSKMFTDTGVVNVILQRLRVVNSPIPFLTDANWARVMVIMVNIWVGIPYTMLMSTGILMNIPAELYESASIDGATPIQTFVSITMPYMLFVTGPYLITTFVGNINNFNVIYLLTAGGPATLDYYQGGKTDLLVTWLYKLTVNEQNYSLASTIGIFIFVIVAALSLTVYNLTGSVKKEDQFS